MGVGALSTHTPPPSSHATLQNGEVECGDVQPLCPPTPCPLELRVQPRQTCCAFCSRPGFDSSSGSGSPPVEVYKGASGKVKVVGGA